MGKSERRDSIDDIKNYYTSSSEDRRLGIQQLEFEITRRLLDRYLKPNSNVLELGAGGGRYTVELLDKGHRVTSVEMVPGLVEVSRQSIQAKGLVASATLINGDARDFRDHTQETFDVALAMGPFYHLVSAPERATLLKDMIAAVKPGGLVITIHLTRVGLMGYMMTRFPAWGLEAPDQIKHIMTAGHLPDHPRNGEFRGYFTTLKEIQQLHEKHGLEIVRLHSQDPCIGSVDEIFNRLPDDIKEAWADALTALSHDPLALGSGRGIFCVACHKT